MQANELAKGFLHWRPLPVFLADKIYDAARELGIRGYPLYTVTYGPAGDAAQSRDVAVENLPVFFKDVKKTLLSSGADWLVSISCARARC